MQAHELMIGDWIADRGGKHWQIDHWENPTKVAAKPPTYHHPALGTMQMHPLTEEVEYLRPIPLTSEIVKNLNAVVENYGLFYFRRDGSNKSESGMDIVLVIKECLIEEEWVWDCSFGNFPNQVHLRYIKYVHELQHIFQFLTGKILTFKNNI